MQSICIRNSGPYFSRTRTEYGETLFISPYSVRMRENTDQNNSEYEKILRSVFKNTVNTPSSTHYFLFFCLCKKLGSSFKFGIIGEKIAKLKFQAVFVLMTMVKTRKYYYNKLCCNKYVSKTT